MKRVRSENMIRKKIIKNGGKHNNGDFENKTRQ